MFRFPLIALGVLLPMALASNAFAQDYVGTPPSQPPPPGDFGTASGAEGLYITPQHGQSQETQWADRYACSGWAKSQTGYDPVHPGAATGPNDTRRAQYRQAMTACLEGRGYTVSTAPPPGAVPPPAPAPYRAYPPYPAYPPPVYARQYPPQPTYHPVRFGLDLGFSPPTGGTSDYLDWGANVGLVLTWFPSAQFPLGLRVDPSFSWFHLRSGYFDYGDWGYDWGYRGNYQDIYGTDVDLQLNLGRYFGSLWGSQFYLLGGPGWYRVHSDLHNFGSGDCFYCGPGYPFSGGTLHTTSSWRDSWNIGLGWETALDSHTSVFVEARYQSIDSPAGGHLEFVPVRFGIRF